MGLHEFYWLPRKSKIPKPTQNSWLYKKREYITFLVGKKVYKWKRTPKDKGIMPTSPGTTIQRKRQKYRGSKGGGGGGGGGTDFRFCFICFLHWSSRTKFKLKRTFGFWVFQSVILQCGNIYILWKSSQQELTINLQKSYNSPMEIDCQCNGNIWQYFSWLCHWAFALYKSIYIYIMCNCDNSKASNGLEGVWSLLTQMIDWFHFSPSITRFSLSACSL